MTETTIVCTSDTHGMHDQVDVPAIGEVVVHAGDCTRFGSRADLGRFLLWFQVLPQRTKILVAGNHDWCFQRHPEESRDMCRRAGVHYLEDSGLYVEGLVIWGSPWTPQFHDWAFMLARGGQQLREKWQAIPLETDVLVTHGPPSRVLDRAVGSNGHAGCELLRQRLAQVRPKLHVFGHIHEGYGQVACVAKGERAGETDFVECVNASACTVDYRPTNRPVVVQVEKRTTPPPLSPDWGKS